jgi:hypothetical protein
MRPKRPTMRQFVKWRRRVSSSIVDWWGWCHRMKNFRKWCGWDNTHRILYYQFFFILFISIG